MEQITLTKEELKEIVAKEVRQALGKKPIKQFSIFSEVRLDEVDIANINEDFSFTKFIKTPFRGRHYKPLAIRKYPFGGNEYFNGKVNDDHIHDFIRKLTLAVFGVTRNSDLSKSEYEEAAELYEKIKSFYLHQYTKRLSKLTIEDFE
ncbi:hypothetical protein [Staphylococcus pseudintermedius]|uniref:hypothetical protein n=1 Tax=Staphylococcus pseudintermedius TaxID=283734 RepID=UPI00111DB317|nr:hypothetical protein [Staphylococcus pseudintermedius]EGQ1685687.1 hypothetical protein [Staphylococcus pseudintermedius]EGQ2875386.1 hypothetical protein [Staphylococcus pseudintermedius]EGQ3323182.1 hypothetical protein [Staphylococcus pseudintermedius]EGQ3508630.1 hypothetical protein [Staphylococcus pseudintermedius]EGQ3742480.1 hypothetical protein [Staphylococcus pseudintermedius]